MVLSVYCLLLKIYTLNRKYKIKGGDKMNRIKKYRVKYRNKLTLLQCMIITVIIIALIWAQRSIADFIQVPLTVFIIQLFFLTLVWFGFYYKSRYSFSEVQRLKAKLFHVIKSNKLFLESNDDGHKRTYSTLAFYFYQQKNSLFVEAHAKGDSYTKKSADLRVELESALDLTLVEKDATHPSFTCYEFALRKINRLQFLSPADIPKENETIQLDEEKVWKPYRAPHILIAGTTGAGKSYTIFILLLQMARQGWDIYIADPKQNDLASLRFSIPNGESHIASTPPRIAKMVREVVELMNERNNTYFNSSDSAMGKDYRHYKLRPIILVFDEVASFQEMDKKIGAEVMSYLKQIIMMGRQVGVFLLIATQRPDHNAFDTAIRDQFGLRIALGKMSSIGFKMTLGEFEELPSSLYGNEVGTGYILIDGEGWSNPRSFQSAYIDMDAINYQETLKRFLMVNQQED